MMLYLERVQHLLCDLFTCVYKKSSDNLQTLYQNILNKRFIKSLTTIGRLLPMQTILTMHGLSTSTTAMTIRTLRTIVFMFGVSETESKNV